MKIDWITDPHLNCLKDEHELIAFCKNLRERDSDALFITGDIAVSDCIHDILKMIEVSYGRPVYFVLGNHDFWGNSFAGTRSSVHMAVVSSTNLNYLTSTPEGVSLTPDVSIVGHDGWYDGRAGDFRTSNFMMRDFLQAGITDLVNSFLQGSLIQHIGQLGDESADAIKRQIDSVLASKPGVKEIYVLTHVPPFHEASYYRGKPADAKSAPWYVNVSLGLMLTEIAKQNPSVQFKVFAGHTHGSREYQHMSNLTVSVGHSKYGSPKICQTLQIPD